MLNMAHEEGYNPYRRTSKQIRPEADDAIRRLSTDSLDFLRSKLLTAVRSQFKEEGGKVL